MLMLWYFLRCLGFVFNSLPFIFCFKNIVCFLMSTNIVLIWLKMKYEVIFCLSGKTRYNACNRLLIPVQWAGSWNAFGEESAGTTMLSTVTHTWQWKEAGKRAVLSQNKSCTMTLMLLYKNMSFKCTEKNTTVT